MIKLLSLIAYGLMMWVAAEYAESSGRSWFFWMMVAFFFSPVVAIFLIWIFNRLGV